MVSIVICTSNRAEKLSRCMNALDRSTGDLQPVPELIVVDNNSSDDTRAVVERFREASFLTVKYLKESKQGLSFARNTGVREATSSIIAFTDDDCVPSYCQK